MKKENSHIQRIFDLYMSGEFPKEAEDAFLEWLASPVHAGEKDRALGDIFDRMEADSDADAQTYISLRNVRAKLGLPVSMKTLSRSDEKNPAKLKPSLRNSWWLKVAAVLIPLIVLTVLTYRVIERPAKIEEQEMVAAEEPQMVRISVPATSNADEDIILADGSKIRVKPGSTIIYAENFEELRKVELTGAASFEVVRTGGDTPFVVKTEYLTATVLGTEFNVEAYPENDFIEIKLNSGKLMVDITGKNAASTMMEPGDVLAYNYSTGNMTLNKTAEAKTSAGKETPQAIAGKLPDRTPMKIAGMSIHEIFNCIEKHYNVTVEVNATLSDDEKYDITFSEGEKLEDAMWILKELTGNWKYSIKGNNITITN